MNKKFNKLKRVRKAKEITKTILKIAAAGGLTIIAGGGTHNPDKAKRIIKEFAKYSLSRVRECLKRLKMQDYINYTEDDLTRPIVLTQKGLERLAIQSFKDKLKACTMRKWDRLWRLVTFDVRENDRWKRDGFREHLKRMNFYKLQKNIYVIPYPVEKELEDLIKSYRMWKDALILHVADLGKREQEIKEYFISYNKKK